MKLTKIFFSILLCLAALQAKAVPENSDNPNEADRPTEATAFEQMRHQLNEGSLPIVNLRVDIDKVSKPLYTEAVIEIADPLMRTNLKDTLTTFRCKVKYRGSSSLQYEKKSFGVKLLNEKGKSLDANIMGIRKDDAWILDAMAPDRTRMRNRLNFDIWNAMSMTPYATDYDRRNGTKGTYVELFINGAYHGLYCLSDKVNRKLLGIKKAKEEDGDVSINGVMYKAEQWSSATMLNGYDDEDMTAPIWNQWELDYPDDYPCPETYAPLKAFIDYCAHSTDDDFAAGINKHLYLRNVVDYQVFWLSQGLTDNHMKNSFLSIVNIKKGQRVMITPWDLDCSLGGLYNGNYYNYPSEMGYLLSVGLYRRLWNGNINAYQSVVADRWRELYATTLSEEAFNHRVDNYAQALVLSGAWQREYEKWNDNPVPLQEDLNEETAYIKQWYSTNCQHLADEVFRDIESGIASVPFHEPDTDSAHAFNLMGQKVNNTYKGIVVYKGKKVKR